MDEDSTEEQPGNVSAVATGRTSCLSSGKRAADEGHLTEEQPRKFARPVEATTANVPGLLPHVKLEDHQEKVANEVDGKKAVLIWWDPGTGKTLGGLNRLVTFLKKYPNAKVAIVCPSGLKTVWMEHIEQFTNFSSLVACGRDAVTESKPIKIVSYSEVLWQFKNTHELVSVEYTNSNNQAQTRQEFLRKPNTDSHILFTRWDFVILDESHAVRNPGRLKVTNNGCRLMTRRAVQVLLLTGTPIHNSPLDLCGQFIAASSPSILADPDSYGDFGCLNARILEEVNKNSSRVTLQEAGFSLFPKEVRNVFIEHNFDHETVKLYNDKLEWTKRLVRAANEENGNAQELNNMLSMLRTFVLEPGLSCDRLKKDHRGNSVFNPEDAQRVASNPGNKLQVIVKETRRLLETHRKVVVACDSVRALDVLSILLKDVSQIAYDGRLGLREKDAAVKSFLNSPDRRILLLSMFAGGEGLNLVPGPTAMVVCSVWFNPARHEQLEARIHRRGQDRPVEIVRVIVNDTIEPIILRSHAEKSECAKLVREGCLPANANGEMTWRKLAGIATRLQPLSVASGRASCSSSGERVMDEQPKKL